jgi:uncharacterized protein with FMN-binding domain
MKRAPIVLSGTALGVVGVLAYHTASPRSSAIGALTGSAAAQGTGVSSGRSTSPASGSSGSTTSTPSARTTAARAAATPGSATPSPALTRSATGADVSFQYGELQVKVTMTGTKISNVSFVRLSETDPRSQSIDQIAIPQLQQETMSAQSARIDGVSGASYTSQAYDQSLQSALDKLA